MDVSEPAEDDHGHRVDDLQARPGAHDRERQHHDARAPPPTSASASSRSCAPRSTSSGPNLALGLEVLEVADQHDADARGEHRAPPAARAASRATARRRRREPRRARRRGATGSVEEGERGEAPAPEGRLQEQERGDRRGERDAEHPRRVDLVGARPRQHLGVVLERERMRARRSSMSPATAPRLRPLTPGLDVEPTRHGVALDDRRRRGSRARRPRGRGARGRRRAGR